METEMEKKLRLAKELIEIYLDPKCKSKTELDLITAIDLIDDCMKLNKILEKEGVSKKMFAVVQKCEKENKPSELLLASTKKQAIILYKHWHYIITGGLNLKKNLCVKEFKVKNNF